MVAVVGVNIQGDPKIPNSGELFLCEGEGFAICILEKGRSSISVYKNKKQHIRP